MTNGEWDYDDQAQRALDAMGADLAESTFAPLHPDEFDVEKDGVTLNVQVYGNGSAMVLRCDPETGINNQGEFAPYHRMPMEDAKRQMQADGWSIKTTRQMIVTQRGAGYNNVTVSGVCSPDITVEDIKKRFYHSYFGGRDAWVRDGKFGCTIHTD